MTTPPDMGELYREHGRQATSLEPPPDLDGKRLFVATFRIYVMAETLPEAREVAQASIGKDGADVVDSVYQVLPEHRLPAAWASGIPFGATDDLTCRQVLEVMREQAVGRKRAAQAQTATASFLDDGA